MAHFRTVIMKNEIDTNEKKLVNEDQTSVRSFLSHHSFLDDLVFVLHLHSFKMSQDIEGNRIKIRIVGKYKGNG